MFKWASTASPTLLVWTRSFEITARHWNVPWAGWQVGKLRLLTKEAFRLPSFFTVSERVAVEAIIVKVETNRAFVWVCLHRAAECCRRREGVGKEGRGGCSKDILFVKRMGGGTHYTVRPASYGVRVIPRSNPSAESFCGPFLWVCIPFFVVVFPSAIAKKTLDWNCVLENSKVVLSVLLRPSLAIRGV